MKLLSNGMLYYEVCGEGLLAWRSEFCVDDFVFGDGEGDGGAVFSGIKCKGRCTYEVCKGYTRISSHLGAKG